MFATIHFWVVLTTASYITLEASRHIPGDRRSGGVFIRQQREQIRRRASEETQLHGETPQLWSDEGWLMNGLL